MKVEHILIRNFKKFRDVQISFKDSVLDEVSNRYLILGDNGSGKTTLLQAIALPLAMATGQIYSIEEFDWIGFLPERFGRWGRPYIELTVQFTKDEIEHTQQLAQRWYDGLPQDLQQSRQFTPPSDNRIVTLILDGTSCRSSSPETFYQFKGLHYLKQLYNNQLADRSEFSKVPRVFWFDQFRNLASRPDSLIVRQNGNSTHRESPTRLTYEFGVERLREYLNGWKLRQATQSFQDRFDYLDQLEKLFQTVFPQRTFYGVEPMPNIDSPTSKDYYFLINDGIRTYDIAEMSAGEQNIFPILYEFVRQQISNSVILIDEIDLNLHPPAAQAFARQLPKIDPTSQFILTTHSDAVNNLIAEEETYRLKGDGLCL